MITAAPSIDRDDSAPDLSFDPVTGGLRSFGALPVSGPEVGVWRAPTDNDNGRLWGEEDETPMATRWREAGMDRTVSRLVEFSPGASVRVVTRTGVPIHDCAIDARLTWTPVNATIRTDAGSLGIRTVGDPFALTVSPFSRSEVHRAEHVWDLRADGKTHVSIDLAQSGVGTASCGPGTLPMYRLAPRSFRTSLLFERR